MGEASLEAEAIEHLRADPVKLRLGNGANGVAGLADQVLVLRSGERVQARPVAEMNVADEPYFLQRLEVAIDRGQIGARQPPFQSLGDTLGRKRPLGTIERLEHEPARGRDSQPALAQSLDGGLDIGGAKRRTAVSGRQLDLLR